MEHYILSVCSIVIVLLILLFHSKYHLMISLLIVMKKESLFCINMLFKTVDANQIQQSPRSFMKI